MKHTMRNILLGALLAIGLGVPYLQAADVAISALPAGSALAGTEPIPMVQGAATKKTTPADISTYLLSGSATTEVLANNAGAFDGDSGFTFNATNNTVDLGGATLTASDPILDLSQTWNAGGVTFTGWKFNLTDTASAAASLLADWQVASTSVARITKAGVFRTSNTAEGFTINAPGQAVVGIGRNDSLGGLNLYGSGVAVMADAHLVAAGLRLPSTGGYGFASGSVTQSTDLIMVRDAADTLAQRRTTNAQTLRVYDTYTDGSNYGRLALNTSLTGDWVQIAAETAGTGADNYGIALSPSGNGAIAACVPNADASCGSSRGAGATDWQLSRAQVTEVASAQSSTISGGYANTASGSYSNVAGGLSNIASGTAATVGGGQSNTASGINSWVPGGRNATTRGLSHAYAWSGQARAASGDSQVIGQPVRRTTTDATPVSLSEGGAAPASTTVMVLPASSTLMCDAMVVAQSASAANNAGYKVSAVIQRDGSNNTALVGSATTTTVGEDTAGMDATIIANDTLESAEIQVTGVAATTIQWMGELKCVQVL